MQDQDALPAEEGEAGGGVVAVQEARIQAAGLGATISKAGFTALPWITATARPSREETMGPGRDD